MVPSADSVPYQKLVVGSKVTTDQGSNQWSLGDRERDLFLCAWLEWVFHHLPPSPTTRVQVTIDAGICARWCPRGKACIIPWIDVNQQHLLKCLGCLWRRRTGRDRVKVMRIFHGGGLECLGCLFAFTKDPFLSLGDDIVGPRLSEMLSSSFSFQYFGYWSFQGSIYWIAM